MNNNLHTAKGHNFFLRLHPIHRVLISLLFAIATFAIVYKNNISTLVAVMFSWFVFSVIYLILDWIILLKRPITQIKKVANVDDGSVAFVSAMILVSSITSLFAVLEMMVSKGSHNSQQIFEIPASIGCMLLSWIMVHTVFTFHYAHYYYSDRNKNKGLQFPGDEEPDYLDFAYFSFVIGCTFQVSDVEVASKKIRHIVFFHGVLSFALNTFVVALTINFIAALMN